MMSDTDVCRLCLSKEGLMFPIFQNPISRKETSFRSKIMSCASVEIFADDELPSKVCFLCLHQVEKFFQFQAMCENSDLVLRSQLKETKILHKVHQDSKNVFVLQNNGDGGEKCTLPNYYSSSSFEKKMNFDTLTCNICSSMFMTNSHLIDHLIRSHPDLNLLFCKNCKVAFSHMYQFKNHLNMHNNLTCNYCDSVFKYEKSLKDHLKIHVKHLACKFCSKTFKNLYDMKKHELLHSEKNCNFCCKELDSKTDYDCHLKECAQKHCCQFCKLSFKCKKELIEHVNTLHSSCNLEKCDDCEVTILASDWKEQKCDSEEDNEELFQCIDCQIQCKDELSLVNHMSAEHSSGMLTCKFCAKKFGLRSSLKRHERSHSGVKPYQCKFCPRKFKDSSACVVHTRTHTGEHPFRCQECQKDFKQLANLKMHTYRHHKKNKKSVDLGTEILNEGGNDYEHLYTGHIMENYSADDGRGYQVLNETISNNFNQDINILMPNQQST